MAFSSSLRWCVASELTGISNLQWDLGWRTEADRLWKLVSSTYHNIFRYGIKIARKFDLQNTASDVCMIVQTIEFVKCNPTIEFQLESTFPESALRYQKIWSGPLAAHRFRFLSRDQTEILLGPHGSSTLRQQTWREAAKLVLITEAG